MCHHYRLRAEFKEFANALQVPSDDRQLEFPQGDFYPLATVSVIRLNADGEREPLEGLLVPAEDGALEAEPIGS